MTTTQRNSISAVNGTIIYNTTDNAFQFYQNGSWALLGTGGGGGGGDTIITLGNGILTIADDGPGGTHRALLEKYHASASSYASKIVYLTNTGSSPVDPSRYRTSSTLTRTEYGTQVLLHSQSTSICVNGKHYVA